MNGGLAAKQAPDLALYGGIDLRFLVVGGIMAVQFLRDLPDQCIAGGARLVLVLSHLTPSLACEGAANSKISSLSLLPRSLLSELTSLDGVFSSRLFLAWE